MIEQTLPLSERARTLKPSSTLAVTARVAAMKAEGADVIGFGAGQPDFDTPENIKQAAINAMLSGKTKYQPTPGPMDVRRTIARKLREENSIECEGRDVVITTGGKQALYATLQAIIDTGDEVILLTPCWVSYRPMVQLAGGTLREVAGSIDNSFKITPQQLEDAITQRTRAVMINSPSNPCGTMYSGDELRELASVIERHPRIVVISDEIYEKLIYGGEPHVSPGSFESIANRVITINGLSKAYAMTGWRIGYLCAPGRIWEKDGDDSGAGETLAMVVPRLMDQMTSCITSFNYAAITEALTNCAEQVETMRQEFAARAELVHSLLAALPDVPCPRPTGAFYVFPDVGSTFGRTTPEGRTIDSALAFAEALLEEAQVAVVPGDAFGECAKTNIRVSFATSRDEIKEGCDRIGRWMKSLR